MKVAPTIEFEDQNHQDEQDNEKSDSNSVFNKMQCRELEVVNEEGQVVVLISSHQDPESKSNQLISFFNNDGEKVGVFEVTSFGGGIFRILNEHGSISISSDLFGSNIDLKYQSEFASHKVSIGPNWDGGSIKVCDNKEGKDNSISLKIDMDDGEVSIKSEYTDQSDQREIETVKTLFKIAK